MRVLYERPNFLPPSLSFFFLVFDTLELLIQRFNSRFYVPV